MPLVIALSTAIACDSTPYEERSLASSPRADASSTERLPGPVLRMSVAAMLSPQETHSAYAELLTTLGHAVGSEIELVQRRSYREVNELLLDGRVDVALLCTGGYLELRARAPQAVDVVAVPITAGRATYESLVIVPAESPATDLASLAGKRFAFTDELSLSGRAYVVHALRALGADPASHFASSLFTHSHDRSVAAVANRLVDGAAVDSSVYDQLLRATPELGRRTRIIHRSPPFPNPPVVASLRLDAALRARLRATLLALHEQPAVGDALRRIGVDRFAPAEPALYDATTPFVGQPL